MKKIIYILLLSFCINSINAADEQTLLETVGFLSASKVMITAYGLGSAYDGWVTDSYNDSEFEDLILFYQNFIIATQEQLNSLYRYGDLEYEDKEFIGEIVEIYDALHEQSRMALKYSYTLKEADLNGYTSARKVTIDKMNRLFDLGWE